MTQESTLNAINGRKKTLTLADGKKYIFTPMTLEGWGELENFLQNLPYDKLEIKIDRYGHIMSQTVQDREWEAARVISHETYLGSETFENYLVSPKIMSRVAYLSCKESHPDMTSEVMILLLTAPFMVVFQEAMTYLNAPLKDDSDSKEEEDEEGKK